MFHELQEIETNLKIVDKQNKEIMNILESMCGQNDE